MFAFNALWLVSNSTIKDSSLDGLMFSPPPMHSSQRKSWLFPFGSWRSPLVERQSPSTESNVLPTSNAPSLTSFSTPVNRDDLEKANPYERKFTSRRSPPLFDQKEPEASQPSLSNIASEDNDFSAPESLYHPRPRRLSPSFDLEATYHPLHGYITPPRVDEGTPPPPSPRNTPSPCHSSTPSLVPTVIGSRSPSPEPHFCVSEARDLGIKVRDFAYESHGVPLAPPVPDIDQLKARYSLYRAARLTPPHEVIRQLKEIDEEWLADAEERFEARLKESNPPPEIHIPSWKREIPKWRALVEDEHAPVLMHRSASEDSDALVEITSELEAISLSCDLQEEMGAKKDDNA